MLDQFPIRRTTRKRSDIYTLAEWRHESYGLKTRPLQRFGEDWFSGIELKSPVFTPVGGKVLKGFDKIVKNSGMASTGADLMIGAGRALHEMTKTWIDKRTQRAVDKALAKGRAKVGQKPMFEKGLQPNQKGANTEASLKGILRRSAKLTRTVSPLTSHCRHVPARRNCTKP